jgi:hypothetical protein
MTLKILIAFASDALRESLSKKGRKAGFDDLFLGGLNIVGHAL